MSMFTDLKAAMNRRSTPADRAQIRLAAEEYAEIDGTVVDLSRDLIDVLGTRWMWTGTRDGRGEPPMQSRTEPAYPGGIGHPYGARPVPLADVYRDHGPLIEAPHPPTREECRDALLAPTPRDVFGGAA